MKRNVNRTRNILFVVMMLLFIIWIEWWYELYNAKNLEILIWFFGVLILVFICAVPIYLILRWLEDPDNEEPPPPDEPKGYYVRCENGHWIEGDDPKKIITLHERGEYDAK